MTVIWVIAISAGYLLTNRMHVGAIGTTLEMPFDLIIPFNRHWVWIYYSFYLVILIPVFFISDRMELRRAFVAYWISTVITLAFYAFWTTVMVRPDIIGNDLSAGLMRFLYRTDLPFNCFPSQHVAYSWTAAVVALRVNKIVGIIETVLAVLISLSTLFIKQHWFVDVLGGIAVAALAFILTYALHTKASVTIRDN